MLSLAIYRLRQRLFDYLPANGICLGQRNRVKYDEDHPLIRLDLHEVVCPSGNILRVGDRVTDPIPGVPAFTYSVVGEPSKIYKDQKVVISFLEMEGRLWDNPQDTRNMKPRRGTTIRVKSLFAVVAYAHWLELLEEDPPGSSSGPVFPTIKDRVAVLPLEGYPSLPSSTEIPEAQPQHELFFTNSNRP